MSKYFLNVVEQFIMNKDPKYKGMRTARIEVHSDDEQYAIHEGFMMLPGEIFESVYNALDWKEMDKLPFINLNPEKK